MLLQDPPNFYALLIFRERGSLHLSTWWRHPLSCLLCLLYILYLIMGGLDNDTSNRRTGAARCPQTIFCLVTSWYTHDDDASFGPPEAFICEHNSESDRFAILRPTRHFSILPSTNLAAMLTISHTVALPSCRDRDKSVTFSPDCYIFEILTIYILTIILSHTALNVHYMNLRSLSISSW